MRFGLFATIFSIILLANALLISAQADNSTISGNSTIVLKTIEVDAKLSKEKFSPGDKIRITGTAKIGDNEDINGLVKIKIDDYYSTAIKDGHFSLEVTLSDLIKSGDHILSIEVKDSEGNTGSVKNHFYVLPMPKRVEVYLNNNSFSPGGTIEASAIVRDQNSEPIDTATIMTVYDSRGAEVAKVVVHDEKFVLDLPSDALPGDWWIYAYSDSLKARRFFEVYEEQEIETYVNGSNLFIKNTGNVPYRKPITITFWDKGDSDVKSVNLNIAVGAEAKIELSGFGKYKLDVASGDAQNHFEGVSLTGGVVGAQLYGDVSQLVTGVVVFVSAVVAFALALRIRKKGLKAE